eukprot:CAMPEP_0176212166 /NCGR_PEP_ID=MMETSP0121_2-20121125/15017_1 /TAXON_ID=160619 /ORGANISM="Kryptoperidinium foliaceum, Strain CCMP 1326" /LENGTH=306 /DNA_ID=CAMNT_0017551217 /DNA_START=137 /DNA_END=1054 /DNA_ORIENTATION=+
MASSLAMRVSSSACCAEDRFRFFFAFSPLQNPETMPETKVATTQTAATKAQWDVTRFPPAPEDSAAAPEGSCVAPARSANFGAAAGNVGEGCVVDAAVVDAAVDAVPACGPSGGNGVITSGAGIGGTGAKRGEGAGGGAVALAGTTTSTQSTMLPSLTSSAAGCAWAAGPCSQHVRELPQKLKCLHPASCLHFDKQASFEAAGDGTAMASLTKLDASRKQLARCPPVPAGTKAIRDSVSRHAAPDCGGAPLRSTGACRPIAQHTGIEAPAAGVKGDAFGAAPAAISAARGRPEYFDSAGRALGKNG